MDLDYKFLSPSKIKQQDILQTNQNTATNKQENQLESKNSDKIVDNKETLGFKTLENESAKRNSIATNQTLVPNATTLSIPKLGIFNSTLNEGSLRNIPDIDNKLLYGAVLENQVSNSPCSIGHSYIYGHSEPAESWQNAYPGVRIFANLHTLGIGDRIEIKTKTGQSCVYELVRWDQVETSQNQTLSADQLNFVFNPGEGINLTIQTCKLGSATVRNLLRARLIN
jgi:sortase (surface protein transpeptidase)